MPAATSNTTPDTLLARLFLDAQEEFLAAIDHVPAPGRGGPIGSLNAAGWIIAHATSTHDAWINLFSARAHPDEWIDNWRRQAGESTPGTPIPPFEEARGSFERVAASATLWVATTTWDTLVEPATLPEGSPTEWQGVTRAYLVARGVAHLYVHAGELSVIASLMAAGDLGLPGDLPRSSPPTTEDDPSVPAVAALLRDGFVEVRRAAHATPTPAAAGAMHRLNPVSHTLAHLLGREDRLWSVEAQGNEPAPTLGSLDAGQEPVPLPWDRCLTAFDEVETAIARWLDGMTPPVGARPLKWHGDSSAGAQLARSATHFFSHAGEIMAHASLYGVSDIDMPGALAHVRAAIAAEKP